MVLEADIDELSESLYEEHDSSREEDGGSFDTKNMNNEGEDQSPTPNLKELESESTFVEKQDIEETKPKPIREGPLKRFEEHAAIKYTQKLFYLVRAEICAEQDLVVEKNECVSEDNVFTKSLNRVKKIAKMAEDDMAMQSQVAETNDTIEEKNHDVGVNPNASIPINTRVPATWSSFCPKNPRPPAPRISAIAAAVCVSVLCGSGYLRK
ncbi:hypothetical protein ACJIZ3_019648 [Penstemon smallii]|uniref:Uncharacterized protein n=1 Tax=Penstemon smallii TaxID=265156 RepID=A0ABD3T2L2_9LAMI